jgi:hypothetical protein
LCSLVFFVPFICGSLPSRGWSLDSWTDGVSRCPPACSCSMPVWTRCLLSSGIPCACVAITPHAARRLITISPYLAKFLAVIALCQTILVFYASTLIDMWQRPLSLKVSWYSSVLGRVMRKRERLDFSGRFFWR